MASKITIVGAGSVGATLAFALSQESFVSQIVLIDVIKDKAEGEATDIAQGTAFRDPISIYSGEYSDAAGSDIVIITSGVARKPGQSRLDLAQTNVNIIKSIAPELGKYAPDALYIIVANPVDIMTYTFMKYSGIPENRIMGSGTQLDTARLRYGLSRHYHIAQKNIHAYVFGEHGDSSFIPWSVCNISGMQVDEYDKYVQDSVPGAKPLDKEEIYQYVKKSGSEIIKKKGATFYGVTVAVVNLIGMLLADYETITTVSTMMHGEYGVDDVCLSCLAVIGPNGVKRTVPVKLTDEEVAKMRHSADSLKAIIDGLKKD
ncbi:MAG: L-lactate dehydrogenase [Lachnospiraceae bacterium]|jgi:L-lactate dehydrogenase